MEYKGRNIECELLDSLQTDLHKAVCTLFDAILNVKKSYLEFEEPEKKVWVSHLERVFAYELYHQWSNILKREKLLDIYLLNAEIGKNTDYFGSMNDGIKFPDMVLHHNQGDNENQGIICEIKRKEGFNNKSFQEDIIKLEYFLQDETDYRFAIGVFILVGENIDKIFDKVAYLKKSIIGFRNTKKTSEIQKRILCLTYDGKFLTFSNLYHMIKNTKKRPDNLYCVNKEKRSIIIQLKKD